MAQDKITVKACPFCGGQSAYRDDGASAGHGERIEWSVIHCTKCPASVRVADHSIYDRSARAIEAVRLWNQRVAA